MNNTAEQLQKSMRLPELRRWKSGKVTVCLSSQHKDMHIVNHPDGKFHSVVAQNDYMQTKYPPNKDGKNK